MNFGPVLTFTPQQKWLYPDGAIGVRLPPKAWPERGIFRIQSAEDVLTFILAMNTQRFDGLKDVLIPFMPYARQDRRAVEGDPDAVQVMVSLLSSTGINKITAIDVHSDKYEAAFERTNIQFKNYAPLEWVQSYIQAVSPGKRVILVSPDKGALTKTFAYASIFPDLVQGVVVCNKQRDPISGRLMKFGVECYHDISDIAKHTGSWEHLPRANAPMNQSDRVFVIVDDICDGGGTFHGVHEALMAEFAACPVHLWTTHGIYSKGIDDLLAKFETIGSTDSFLSTAPAHERRILYKVVT